MPGTGSLPRAPEASCVHETGLKRCTGMKSGGTSGGGKTLGGCVDSDAITKPVRPHVMVQKERQTDQTDTQTAERTDRQIRQTDQTDRSDRQTETEREGKRENSISHSRNVDAFEEASCRPFVSGRLAHGLVRRREDGVCRTTQCYKRQSICMH